MNSNLYKPDTVSALDQTLHQYQKGPTALFTLITAHAPISAHSSNFIGFRLQPL